jgi:glycosyltransferase involved in cell wall biosynthesis
MRVVLDGRMLLPRMTGAGRYVLELGRRLPRMEPRLELVVLVAPALKRTGIPQLLLEAGASLEYVNARVASVRQWASVPRVLRHLSPDLFHYPFLDLPYVSCPSVITVYDMNPLLDREYFANLRVLKRWMAARVVESSIDRSRLVIAISGATRAQLETHLPRSRGKVRVIPLGVDCGQVTTSPPRAGEGVGLRWAARPYFLYVGVDRPHKNLPNLVLGFRSFRLENEWVPGQGPYLLLAGVGEGSARLREAVAASGLAQDVCLGSPPEEPLLWSLYRGATALVYVSRSEGFGLPILEGFCAGVPVITGDRSALPEVAGEAAQYCDPDDVRSITAALHDVWHDQALRRTLVQRGLQRVQEFSWDNTARSTFAAYQAALHRPCGG